MALITSPPAPMALLTVAATLRASHAGIASARAGRVGVALGAVVALTAIPFGAVTMGFAIFATWSLVVTWILLGRSARAGLR